MHLRPYQADCLDKLRNAYKKGKRAPLLVAPTGAGKTVMFAHVVAGRVQKGGRPMVLCHRTELVEQIVRALKAVGIEAGVIAAGYEPNPDAPAQVASVMTLVNRLGRTPASDLLVVDEAHHATPKTSWGKVLAHWPKALRLGVTATPTRLSGEGLSDIFDDLVLGPTTQELIDNGFLSPVRVFAPSSPDLSGVSRRMGEFVLSALEAPMSSKQVVGDALQHYRRHAHGRRAIAFCVSVQHARAVAQQFEAEGYRAASVDGTMDRTTRANIIKGFTDGTINVLTSCDLVSEGFDLPAIEVGISLRPTQSVGLWLQQVGRCLRVCDGKQNAIILDHAGNALRHGLPTDDREWSLEAGIKQPRGRIGEAGGAVRVCSHCFAASPSTSPACKECGQAFPVKVREVKETDGELVEVQKGQIKKRLINNADTLEGLIALGRQRGYANPHGWARHIYEARQKKRTGYWR
jgi:DNA repair protein RadD